MLVITIPAAELWDERNEEFIYLGERRLRLEHSLISLSKWEEKYRKPFLESWSGKKRMPYDEFVDYVRFMTLDKNVDPNVYAGLTENNFRTIDRYINDQPYATWFSDKKTRSHSQIITAEVIYYWMISYGISKEYEKWHLNRLLALIRVFSEKNKPQKKMSMQEIYERNTELNNARKKKLGIKD